MLDLKVLDYFNWNLSLKHQINVGFILSLKWNLKEPANSVSIFQEETVIKIHN